MIQALSRRAFEALGWAVENGQKARITRANMRALASIDEKCDVARVPSRGLDTRIGEMVDLPETGPGYKNFGWTDGALDLDKAEGEALRAIHNHIIDGEGYPGVHARGANELDKAILWWAAEEKELKDLKGNDPDHALAIDELEAEAAAEAESAQV